MASEKRVQISFTVSKSNLVAQGSVSFAEDLTGTDYDARPYTAPTSWTAIPLGSLGDLKMVLIQNTDATNYVQIALDNAGANKIAKIPAGQANFITPDPSATLYIKANAASVVVNLVMSET
jgi:hypothetical protein